MANEMQNSKSSLLLPCDFLLLGITWQGAITWHAQLSVEVMDRVGTVEQVVDGNWLSEKIVCEHGLAIGQAVKNVFLLIQTLGYEFLEL